MWVIIVIVIILVIYLGESASDQLDIMSIILDKSFLGISALISIALGCIYFWASSVSYRDYKIKDKFMNIFNNYLSSDTSLSKREIDLSAIDLQSLVGELQSVLTSPTPIFFKGWGNRRLELDVERVKLMNDYINTVAATGQSFIRLKADSLISYDKIKLLAKTELIELQSRATAKELDLRLLQDRYENELIKLKTQNESLKLGIDDLKLSQEEKKANIRRLNAEAEKAEAIAEQEKAKARIMSEQARESGYRADLINIITGDVKFSDLSISQQTYILTTYLNVDVSKLTDFEIREQLKNSIVDQAKADTIKKTAEADSIKADVEMKNINNQAAKKDAGL